MRAAYEKVRLSQESKRQILISDLLMLGITEFQDKGIENLDYYTLRHALSVHKACAE